MTQVTNLPSSFVPKQLDSDFSRFRHQLDYFLSKVQTCLPVRVIAVNAAGVAPVGTVDISIMVQQTTVTGDVLDGATVYNVPYFRLQGGDNAIIIDPKVGDIGIGLFCSKDISSIKVVKKDSPPSSLRTFSLSDCFFIGGILNQAPKQYIHFTDNGIVVYSPSSVTITAPKTEINSVVTVNGAVTINDKITVTGIGVIDGVSVGTHTHGGVQSGSSSTGAPN